LVPATMELLGDRNWWLPPWLDKLLPNLNVEGTIPASRTTDPTASDSLRGDPEPVST